MLVINITTKIRIEHRRKTPWVLFMNTLEPLAHIRPSCDRAEVGTQKVLKSEVQGNPY